MTNLTWLCGALFLATILAAGFAQAIDLSVPETVAVLVRSR